MENRRLNVGGPLIASNWAVYQSGENGSQIVGAQKGIEVTEIQLAETAHSKNLALNGGREMRLQ